MEAFRRNDMYNVMRNIKQREDGSSYWNYFYEDSETGKFVKDLDEAEIEHVNKQLREHMIKYFTDDQLKK